MHEFSISDVFLPLHLFHHFPQQYRLSECHSVLKFGSVEVQKKRRESRALQQKRLSTMYFCLADVLKVCTEGSVPPPPLSGILLAGLVSFGTWTVGRAPTVLKWEFLLSFLPVHQPVCFSPVPRPNQ
ncbi:hypothetical protein ILYODFUR_034501 [Ilyodon furcidens]|uniref:Uncharacterized protein n=1 Tax=Ilyodon furcidens TaxID=33524 RepID=A0ABV0VJH8_9TELE